MPSERPQLIDGEIYHISDRAVGDSVIFKDENDYFRGIFSLYEFNNDNLVDIWLRRKQRKREKIKEKQFIDSIGEFGPPINIDQLAVPERSLFVEILSFCFMPNHFHLIIRQLKNEGISKFMQKIGGYATYFNKKYDRKGHLFNRFNAVHIKSDEQLRNAFAYVHTNPLSLIEPGWKEKGIKISNTGKAIRFLEEEYRWSSLFDFIDKKNFQSVISRDFFLDFLGGTKGCKETIRNWVRYKEFDDFGDIILE